MAIIALNSFCGNKDLRLSSKINAPEIQVAVPSETIFNGELVDTPIIVKEIIGPIAPEADTKIKPIRIARGQ
jgi:hypothetical protein